MQTPQFDRRYFLAGLAASGAAFTTPAWAKAAKSGDWAAVQSILDDWVAKNRVPGAVAAVGRGVEKVRYFSAGKLAQGDAPAIGPDSLFRAYSQTKTVTGMAAMILIDEGKFTLDTNIADFIPGFANPRVLTEPDKSLATRPAIRGITVRNLLTHTAGLGYNIITKGPLLNEYVRLGITGGQVSRLELPGFPKISHAPSLEAFGDRLATLPLIADPGTIWSYSVGLDLMGRVIEVASGMPFDTFLAERLFKPLGMNSTWFQVPAKEAKRLTTNHFDLNGTPFPIDPGATSIYLDKPPFPFGGGGLVSSPRDWDRFLLMQMGEGAIGKTRIMSKATAQLGMSNIVPEGTVMTSWVKDQGFGAGGRVSLATGSNGEGPGTYGWGGAASTIGWVDRANKLRASGWIQLMTRQEQRFPVDFGKGVYSRPAQ